ncbi:MAG: hypothetical protein LQ352_003856 [Teloschistes flavicans]|nr:MAG: hypothetical protein LQ352_003856 [Teloschistes flavicans]
MARDDKLVALLLRHGADPNSRYTNAKKILTDADQADKDRATRPPTESGVDIQDRKEHSMTALHLAVKLGEFEALHVLLESGADPNALNGQGETPLHLAAKQDDFSFIAVLLHHRSDVDAITHGHERRTALCIAAEHLNLETVRLLVNYGAKVKLTTGDTRRTPLHLAISAFSDAVSYSGNRTNEYLEDLAERTENIVNLLLAHGADHSVVNEHLRHPEISAVKAMLPNVGRLRSLLPHVRDFPIEKVFLHES